MRNGKLRTGGGTTSSKRLLAVAAILAVAFVVLAAVPVAVTESDAEVSGSDVAKIGNTGYATVAAAIAAATTGGETIVLLKDVKEDVSIPTSKDIVLDLNGKRLTNSTAVDTIYVSLGAELTIKDSSTENTGTVDNITHQKAAVFNNGTVVLNGGNYTRSLETGKSSIEGGTNTYYNILNHGTMTVNDGVTVTQNGHFSSLFVNGYYSYTSTNEREGYVSGTNEAVPTATINGGTFSGGVNTVKNDDGAEIIINGGSFTNYTQFALQNHHVATVNGGEFAGAQSALYNCPCGDHDVGQLTVNGGTFAYGTGFADVWNVGSTTGKIVIGGSVNISIRNSNASTPVVLSEGSSVSFTSGSMMPASIKYGNSSATFSDVEAGEGARISAGSIEIEGAFSTDASGTITVTGEAVITGDSALNSGMKLIVDSGAKLTVGSGASIKISDTSTIEVKSGATMSISKNASVSSTGTGRVVVESSAKVDVSGTLNAKTENSGQINASTGSTVSEDKVDNTSTGKVTKQTSFIVIPDTTTDSDPIVIVPDTTGSTDNGTDVKTVACIAAALVVVVLAVFILADTRHR